ncbi:MAG: hypothetical protein ACKVS6_12475 [Planctomycetota bacterium]
MRIILTLLLFMPWITALPARAVDTSSADSLLAAQFQWFVNGSPIDAPPFVPTPGPSPSRARNHVSKFQLTPQLTLVIYRRMWQPYGVALLEVGVFNSPLIVYNQPQPGLPIPSQILPNIEIAVSGANIKPLFPAISTFKPVTTNQRYWMQLPNPTWRPIADGAGFVWPFLLTTDTMSDATFADLAPLFPDNPGSMWLSQISPDFPKKTPTDMALLETGSFPFNASGDPWAVQGKDEKFGSQTGFHADWYWVHRGAFDSTGDINDLIYMAPTVYRQAARPVHYDGFDGSSNAFWFNSGRPAVWGSNHLGRVPTLANEGLHAPIADTHDWFGPSVQHASLRRVAEYAEATGSPWAWAETLHYGELAKATIRTLDPPPLGTGFVSTPRAYLAWLEIAYRAYRLNPNYDMSVAIQAVENYLELAHTKPWAKPWGTPQVRWATFNVWIAGHWGAVSYEDLRFVPILLKVGVELDRPKMVLAALETCEWYCTKGWTNGEEGKGVGIKRVVDPTDPTVFVEADLGAGFNRVSGLGLYLASKYLEANPIPGFHGALMRSKADLILADAKASPEWATQLAGYLPW